jgi:hypothetical protein
MEEESIELLDNDGYPTDYALEKIEKWKINIHPEDFISLMELIKSIWYYPDYIKENTKEHAYTLITGGWSGNEDIIYAMKQNTLLHCFYWYSSERGGAHVYAPMGYHKS